MNRAIELLRRVAQTILVNRLAAQRLSVLHAELSYLRDRADAEQRGWADRGTRNFDDEAMIVLARIERLDAVELAKVPPSKVAHRDTRPLDARLARVRTARVA